MFTQPASLSPVTIATPEGQFIVGEEVHFWGVQLSNCQHRAWLKNKRPGGGRKHI